ncbi:MAG: hypothetical protein ACOC4M_18415 [Promethearchaeia archaeon]
MIKPKNYRFSVDLNNLVTEPLVLPIFHHLPGRVASKLNTLVTKVKFLVGGNQWHQEEPGYLKFRYSEYEIRTRTFFIYIHKMFRKAKKAWTHAHSGSFQREIWTTFTWAVLSQLQELTRVDKALLHDQQDVYWTFSGTPELKAHNYKINANLFKEPLLCDEDIQSLCKSITHTNKIPPLGFFWGLYNKHLSILKADTKNLNQRKKVKLFNELRRLKMGYKYEISLSEFIRAHLSDLVYQANIIEEFKKGNKAQQQFHTQKNYWKHYRKCKRALMRLLNNENQYSKGVHIYRDSADRSHHFLTYILAQHISPKCTEICQKNITQEYPKLLKVRRFMERFKTCPVCGAENHAFNLIRFYFSKENRKMRENLLKAAKEDDEKINVGILCCSCFSQLGFQEPRPEELGHGSEAGQEADDRIMSVPSNFPNSPPE